MKLPTLRGLSCATTASLVLALFSTAPALAQDCWLPDAFEPNDVVPTPIGPGLYTDLQLSGPGIDGTGDLDRFVIDVPPLQRLMLDFEAGDLPEGLPSPYRNRIFGTVTVVGETSPIRHFDTTSTYLPAQPYFDNSTAQSVSVEIEARRDWTQAVGCTDYVLQVSILPRPCDTLQDDALEGPDDCANASVLPAGRHTDLMVFGALRAAGRDFDVYRTPPIAPGDWFSVRIRGMDSSSQPELEVFASTDCSGPLIPPWMPYVINTSSSVVEYTLRVSTEAPEAFATYELELLSEPCSTVLADAFEPNDGCGPFAPLGPGTHHLTLTGGDEDGFSVQIPAGFYLSANATTDSGFQIVEVSGIDSPACPPSGTHQSHYRANSGTTPIDHHLRLKMRDGTCGRYTLRISIEPLWCSPAHLAQNEPNEDCASATQVTIPSGGIELRSALTAGDVDSYRVTVMPGEALELRLSGGYETATGVSLVAHPGGVCGPDPYRVELPRMSGSIHSRPAWMYLGNRGTAPLEYVVQLEPTQSFVGCETFTLLFAPFPWFTSQLSQAPDIGTCSQPIPVRGAAHFSGTIAHGRSLTGAVLVEPGQTLTASFGEAEEYVRCPLELRFHDGPSDCSAGTAAFGSVRYTPPAIDDGSQSYMELTHQHTNTTNQAQRVHIELAPVDGCAPWLTNALVRVELDPRPTIRPYCETSIQSTWPTICPCGNDPAGSGPEGCMNSTGSGARLSATGSTSVATDDLRLIVEGLASNSLGIVFETHTYTAPIVTRSFHDGVLCLGLGAESAFLFVTGASGGWTSPASLAGTLGDVASGDSSGVQVWYRDHGGPCGSGSNTTNAIAIDWK